MVFYFSKGLSAAEESYSANDRELLGLIYFLQRFRCYIEGSEFEIFTDNQVLRYFFNKPNLSRREARWMEYLGQFGITKLTLVKGKVHVLGDVPSHAPHTQPNELALKNIAATSVQISLPEGFSKKYPEDITFREVFRYLNGEEMKNQISKERAPRLVKFFSLKENILYYDSKV